MSFYVYMLLTTDRIQKKSYVGYTNNLKSRLYKHNNNKGAKSTRGYKWKLIFKKKFNNKSDALVYEYKFKKDRKRREIILNKNK